MACCRRSKSCCWFNKQRSRDLPLGSPHGFDPLTGRFQQTGRWTADRLDAGRDPGQGAMPEPGLDYGNSYKNLQRRGISLSLPCHPCPDPYRAGLAGLAGQSAGYARFPGYCCCLVRLGIPVPPGTTDASSVVSVDFQSALTWAPGIPLRPYPPPRTSTLPVHLRKVRP